MDAIKKELPDALVYISERDYALLNGDFSIHEKEAKNEIRGEFCTVTTVPDKLVTGNDSIGSLSVLMTPGHTPGSISLYDKKNGILVAGDALQVQGGIAIAGDKRWLFPFPALATWSMEEAVQSAKMLYQLEISILATGHGDLVESPKEKIRKAINRAEKRMQENEKKKNK